MLTQLWLYTGKAYRVENEVVNLLLVRIVVESEGIDTCSSEAKYFSVHAVLFYSVLIRV